MQKMQEEKKKLSVYCTMPSNTFQCTAQLFHSGYRVDAVKRDENVNYKVQRDVEALVLV